MSLKPVNAGPPTLGLVGDDGTITAKREIRGICIGHKLVLEEHERTVTCSACKKVLEPFEALLHLAFWPDKFRQDIAYLTSARKRAEDELEEVKRQLRNAKSSLRRAHGLNTPEGRR